MEVLLLVDMQTVWDSCISQYGKKCRADFNALLTKCKTSRKDNVRGVAFVARKMDKNQDSLVKKLVELGYDVVIKVFAEDQPLDFVTEMTEMLQESDSFQSVVIAGGTAINITVIEAANNLGKHTMIIGFSHGIDKECAQAADDVRVLTRQDTVS